MNLNNQPLIAEVGRIYPELEPEDAFILPGWFSQQDAWLSDPAISDNTAYNCPFSLRVRGELDFKALQASLALLVCRHEVLRSVFRFVNQRLIQIILPSRSLDIGLEDLSALSAHIRETKTREILRKDACLPFDLAHGPLFRARVIRLKNKDHVISLTTHLLVCDDWSTGIILKDLALSYGACAEGRLPPPREPTFRYGDFARELASRQQQGELKANSAFWIEQMAGRDRFEYLTPDKAQANRPLRDGSCERAVFPDQLIQSLTLLSQREKVSLFMTLLAGFKWLLQSYSGDDDVAVGSCAANRLHPKVEGLVGRFGNDIILRTRLSGNPSFRDALGRVREVALTAYSHQEAPFGSIVREVRAQEHSNLDSLCQLMFIFQNAPKEEQDFPGLVVERIPIDPETAKCDLTVWLRLEDGLSVAVEYDSGLFTAEAITRLLSDYREILDQIAKNPEVRLGEMEIQRSRPRGEVGHAQRDPNLVAPRDELERRLVEMWESAFGHKAIGVANNFFELGGDSILASRLFREMEREFKVQLPLSTLFTASTIEQIAQIIRVPTLHDSGNSLLVPIQPAGYRPPFFCFHGAGGNVLIYRELSRYLGSDQPVYGLQSQGLDGRQACLTRIEEMAASYLKDIRTVQPHGPYFLGGYCTGGTIALEAAQQLYAAGEEVALLALFDAIDWSKLGRDSVWSSLYRQLERLLFHARNFALLSFRDQIKFFNGKLNVLRRRSDVWRGMLFGGLERQRDYKPVSSILAEVWEANEQATLSYVPRPYPGIITDFRPMKQYTNYRPGMNWKDVALGGQQIITLPVFPAGMLLEPFVQQLATQLRTRIDEAIQNAEVSS